MASADPTGRIVRSSTLSPSPSAPKLLPRRIRRWRWQRWLLLADPEEAAALAFPAGGSGGPIPLLLPLRPKLLPRR
uniref:Uncharacterized protein n=1 Tax=Oryza punctata TaxID=4537 RepID=A0A0E0LB65_ORYPU